MKDKLSFAEALELSIKADRIAASINSQEQVETALNWIGLALDKVIHITEVYVAISNAEWEIRNWGYSWATPAPQKD